MTSSQLSSLPGRVLMSLAILVFASGLAYGDSIIIDNFNDDSLNASLWTPIVVGNTSSSSISEVGGRLQIAILEGNAFVAVSTSFGISIGDFDLTIRYALPALLPLVSDTGVGVILGSGPFDAYLGIGRDILSDDPNNYVNAYFAQLGRIDPNEFKTATEDLSGTLRLTRVGDFVSAYYGDGTNWTLIHQGSGLAEPVSLLAIGLQISESQSVSASFDDFQLLYAPIPEPATLLLLGTGLGVIGLAAWRRK